MHTTGRFVSFKKELALVIRDKMNEPGGHYAKWKILKTDSERKILHNLTSMQTLKMLSSQKQQKCGCPGPGWGGAGRCGCACTCCRVKGEQDLGTSCTAR